MAGFTIVMASLLLVMVFVCIIGLFELMSILSIIFSAVSLNKSKKFIACGGMYNYRSVKRFHTAAVVFFVFGCIGAVFMLFGILVTLIVYIDTSYAHDVESLMRMLVSVIFSAGKYTALLILGIKSFKKFSQARVLQERSLRMSNFYRQSAPNGFYTAGVMNGQYNNYQSTGISSPYHAEVNGSIVQGNGGIADENNEKKEERTVFGDSIPDKICPKCGCANSGLYKYCTLCGEKLL